MIGGNWQLRVNGNTGTRGHGGTGARVYTIEFYSGNP
jgi:ribosomal protein L15